MTDEKHPEDPNRPDRNNIFANVQIRNENETLSSGITIQGEAADLIRQAAAGPTDVRLDRTKSQQTPDQVLWVAIRNRTKAISFNRYNAFIEAVLCQPPASWSEDVSSQDTTDPSALDSVGEYGSPAVKDRLNNLDIKRPTIQGMDAYKLLKLATEAFLIVECGVAIKDGDLFEEVGPQFDTFDNLVDEAEERRRLGQPEEIQETLINYLGGADTMTLPYLRRIVNKLVGFQSEQEIERLPYCRSILAHRLTCPSLIELIWSYWHEEGMLVQTMNAIALRFQNKRRGAHDPLANLELDPLRPLNNLIWGFIQDEADRLSVQRRAYEYDHHYGITLVGKAVQGFNPADSRTKFIEGFHNLLYRTMMFYRDDDDATFVADAFALLNALREVHILLAEGAHNQFGDLPWKSRKEMLIMQWMLSRPEIREFIRGRHMVPYQEPWIGSVDDMKRLQGWSDVTTTHFHELAIYGEQILLSIRYGDWIDINDQEQARNWARYWRPEIQRYIHAYNTVTGVDLSVEITDTRLAEDRYRQPSTLIADRHQQRSQLRMSQSSQGRLRARQRDDSEPMGLSAKTPRQLSRKA
jgi:hypothetical protein